MPCDRTKNHDILQPCMILKAWGLDGPATFCDFLDSSNDDMNAILVRVFGDKWFDRIDLCCGEK